MNPREKNTAKTNMKKGFTLVEMMVSMAIFAVVAMVAAGALIRIIDANKKAQSIQTAMTNLNFALESLSREMRTGTKYQCGAGSLPADGYTLAAGSCSEDSNSQAGSYVTFVSAEPALGATCSSQYNLAYEYIFKPLNTSPVTYVLEKARQQKSTNDLCSHPASISTPLLNADGDFSPIISPTNVTITGYNIKVSGSQYPLASIRISGYTGVIEKDRTYFTVQTAASTRALEYIPSGAVNH